MAVMLDLAGELAELSNSLKIGKGDAWVRSIQSNDVDNTRTVYFEFHRPLNLFKDTELLSQFDHILMPSAVVSVYFPKSIHDKPFCFIGEDSCKENEFLSKLSEVVEYANEKLLPLSKGSLLVVLSSLKKAMIMHQENIWPSTKSPPWAKSFIEAQLSKRLQEDLLACELTISLFSIAANSYRKETITSPLPFVPAKHQCGSMLEQLVDALDRLPPLSSLQELSHWSKVSLPQLALLTSLLLTARVKLKTLRHEDIGSSLQKGLWAEVEVIQQTKDWNFCQLKDQHGVREAYHGSSAENWYSICHYGLKNMSQTRHERHGAAFGEGVYLSTDTLLSREFSKKNNVERPQLHKSSSFRKYTAQVVNNHRPEFPFEIVCKCDVINCDSNFVPRISSNRNDSEVDYLVVQDETHISMRSLLLYTTPKFNFRTQTETESTIPAPNDQADTYQKPFGNYFYPIFMLVLMLCFFLAFQSSK